MDAEKPGPSGTSLTSRCTVGTKLDQECHKTYYTRKVGLKQVAALEKKSQELISWRSGITFSSEDSICLHHETVYLSRDECRQTSCCDPFQFHTKNVHSKSNKILFRKILPYE